MGFPQTDWQPDYQTFTEPNYTKNIQTTDRQPNQTPFEVGIFSCHPSYEFFRTCKDWRDVSDESSPLRRPFRGQCPRQGEARCRDDEVDERKGHRAMFRWECIYLIQIII